MMKVVKLWSFNGLAACSSRTDGSGRHLRAIFPFKTRQDWIWRHRGYDTPLMNRVLRRYTRQESVDGSSRYPQDFNFPHKGSL